MAEAGQGCVKAAAGPLAAAAPPPITASQPTQEGKTMTIARVGHQAPDFEANVYFNGGFQTMRLSDYKGKWIVLCFYPGDFTFV
ncbi:AhpC/TSA family protein [Trichlorobacter thiogenes]|nr:AhpC/TSA family protein [Trichlorobacter thiogenes]